MPPFWPVYKWDTRVRPSTVERTDCFFFSNDSQAFNYLLFICVFKDWLGHMSVFIVKDDELNQSHIEVVPIHMHG
jgi:hypothetical protein